MSKRLTLDVAIERWPLKKPFRITGYVFDHAEVVVATVNDGAHSGRGEASGVYYRGDTPESMAAAIEAARGTIEAGLTREELRAQLPAGGPRNALDCALWELEAAQAGRPAWRLESEAAPHRLLTTYTVGADTPEVMAQGARDYVGARAIKLKLLGDGQDAERVAAVRRARPEVWIGVDANQGFSLATLKALTPALVAADVKLIEQPLPIGAEADLDGYASPIPLAADESVQGLADVAALAGRFQVMNIKLDKCGGLTEGLLMAHEAKRLGLAVMVGNMTGTSLAMAPAYILGQHCDVVDLDGPMFLRQDRAPGVRYVDGYIECDEAVWGAGA
ncbi:MAG TPA: dipeptide epimerase [Caulobacteraceae bacterium]|jgi:L-alanine-DL-glutamate epimerase-like enolase superfamily enzyme